MYATQGHNSIEKDILVHESTTANQTSIRIVLSVAALFDFNIWRENISQAYIQSTSQLSREAYLQSRKELSIPAGCLLKSIKHLYGLAESEDYWNATFRDRCRNDLKAETPLRTLSYFLNVLKSL